MTKIEELLAAQRELNAKIVNAKDEAEREALEREYAANKREIDMLNQAEMAKRSAAPTKRDPEAQIREFIKQAKQGRENEIVVGTTEDPGAGLDSGAIALTIKDLVPNLESGTGLPAACTIVQGVVGDVVWPTDASDMEIEEAGEVEVLNDQKIDFDNVKADPRRVTLSCDVSNKMIDNLHFSILGHIQKKFQKAWRKYWATKVYSQAVFTGVKGGFSGAEVKGVIYLKSDPAEAILLKVAEFADEGFDLDSLCFTIDAATEARLKTAPYVKGECAGFVIQDGKLLGYDYTVSYRINTVLGGDPKTDPSHDNPNKLYRTTKSYIGIGIYDYLKPQQHGEYRLTIDATSKAQAKKNCVGVVLNTEVSLTNLSDHIYDEDGNAVKAFALLELNNGADPGVTPSITGAEAVAAPKTAGNATRQYRSSDGSGITATVEDGVDWLTATVDANNKVKFTWLANDGEAAPQREADVTLTTPSGAELVVTVTQAANA